MIERGSDAVLQAAFEHGDQKHTLWFSTPKEYGRYLCHERGDAFLVALLLYAMKRGEDIEVLAPVSKRLQYSLTKHYIKAIADTDPEFDRINISCSTDGGQIEQGTAVGTGFSCGVDSFFTVAEHHGDLCPHDYRLTHLAFFNVGSNGDQGGEAARDLHSRRVKYVQSCADELRLPLVTVDSNISEILKMKFVLTSTIRNVAAVLALQKLFRTYYISSGTSLWQFKMDPTSPDKFDIYSSDMLSTEDTRFITSGETYSRLEKTDAVAGYPLSYKYLNVCNCSVENCSRCVKCQRTLVMLDVLGKLDRYSDIFDLDDYRKNRSKYLAQTIGSRKNSVFSREICEEIKRRGYSVPIDARLRSYPQSLYYFGIRHSPLFIKTLVSKAKRSGPGNGLPLGLDGPLEDHIEKKDRC